MNKKGQVNIITETARSFATIFAFILVVIIVSLILINFNQQASTYAEFQTPALTPTMQAMLDYPVIVDWATLIIFGFTWLASLWVLSRLEQEPILYVISWVGILALSATLIGVGYALDQIVSSALLTQATDYMVFIPFYAANAFMFSLLYFFTCAIALHYPKQ